MHKMRFPFLLGAILLLTGCSVIQSSINYTNGTECLEKGDYQGAVSYLNKAVELDPEMSRNHNNLAAAYLALGNNEDRAWYHFRQAVLCSYTSPEAIFSFWSFYKGYVTARGLDREGTSKEEISAKLGQPDITLLAEKDSQIEEISMYGLCSMHFIENKLVGCEKP